MTYQVTSVAANPVLELGPMTVYSGTVRVERAGMAMARSGEPALPFGFFLPDAPPIEDLAAAPGRLLAEAWLMVCRSHSSGSVMGVERVSAAYAPDPRGGAAHWLQLSGSAHAGFGITIGYRVIAQRTATGD